MHHEAWKPIYFGSKVEVTRHKNIAGAGRVALVSVSYF